MTPEFITLTRKDQDFKRYLLGTFSHDVVAVPVESFGVGSQRERVTFKVLDKSSVEKPSWFYIYYRAIRPELLGLTLGHSVVAIASILSLFPQHDLALTFHMWTFLTMLTLTMLGVVFAHASACLFNDFRDHMKGVDRRSFSKGSQVIQKGWCRAVDIRSWAWVNATLAMSIGVYLFWGQWLVFGALLGFSSAAILLHSWMIPFWNRLGAGDFWISFLFGPLLFVSVGLSVLLSALHGTMPSLPSAFVRDVLILSMALGLMASWTLQVRQLQGIFRMPHEGFRTVIARFSFDGAVRFLWWEGFIFAGFQMFALSIIWPTQSVTVLSALFLPLMMYFNSHLQKVKSPLSSEMQTLSRKALMVHAGVLALWMVALIMVAFWAN